MFPFAKFPNQGEKGLIDRQVLTTYQQSADRAVEWLVEQMTGDGSFQVPVKDLAFYYKAPYVLYISGKIQEANHLLSYIQRAFGRENGDFTSFPDLKSVNENFIEYWAYMNGWIALTAQKMGRFDVAYRGYDYLQSFYHPRHGGFTTRKPYGQNDNISDVLTTAHLGLVALYLGDLSKAKTSGHLIQTILFLQPDKQREFYLRMDDNGKLITDFVEDASTFFRVSATQPNQPYFMLGYPIAFLGKLFAATNDGQYIDTAKDYLDFLLRCQGNLRTFHYSHKVAWGAAILAKITKDERYADLAKSIADHLVQTQNPDGRWLPDEPAYTYFDQTAEIAIWMREICGEFSDM